MYKHIPIIYSLIFNEQPLKITLLLSSIYFFYRKLYSKKKLHYWLWYFHWIRLRKGWVFSSLFRIWVVNKLISYQNWHVGDIMGFFLALDCFSHQDFLFIYKRLWIMGCVLIRGCRKGYIIIFLLWLFIRLVYLTIFFLIRRFMWWFILMNCFIFCRFCVVSSLIIGLLPWISLRLRSVG